MGELGLRLRELRRSTGDDQGRFGERVGVSRNTQSSYEKGERTPDAAYLQHIHDLGLDAFYLLTGIKSVGSLTSSESAVVAAMRRLTTDEAEALRCVAVTMARTSSLSQALHGRQAEYTPPPLKT